MNLLKVNYRNNGREQFQNCQKKYISRYVHLTSKQNCLHMIQMVIKTKKYCLITTRNPINSIQFSNYTSIPTLFPIPLTQQPRNKIMK